MFMFNSIRHVNGPFRLSYTTVRSQSTVLLEYQEAFLKNHSTIYYPFGMTYNFLGTL
jgi:hypothetical protein